MSRLILVLIGVLLLIPQPTAAMQGDDNELRFIEAEDPIVQQQGTWAPVEDTDNASGEGYLVSSGEPDDELGLLFEGTQIEVVYLTGLGYGTFHIEIDKEIVQTVDAASDELQFGVRAVVEDLDSGFHIIRVIAVDGTVAVDGFEVTPSDEATLREILAERQIVDEQELLSAVNERGIISVLIMYEVPPGYVARQRLANQELVDKQIANIQLVAQTLLADLEGLNVEVRSQAYYIPTIVLNVDRAALEKLLQLPYLTLIRRPYSGQIESMAEADND